MSTNQDGKCRRHILHLMGDIKNCARQIKIMDLIARFKAEYSDEDIPFDSFWGWLQASNTQIGMLISQIYKLANLKDAQKNLINILGKQFNKNEQEKLFEWTDTARVWGLFSQTYYQRFCSARNKHISHAVYENLVAELNFEFPEMYYNLAALDAALGLLLYLVGNPHWLNQENPFTDENKKSPVLQLNEFFDKDPTIQDFQELLHFIQKRAMSQLNLTPHLYPCN